MDTMPPLKQGLKAAYTYTAATFGQHRRSSTQPRLWVLMYHRILPESDVRFTEEEPGMVVTPSTFKEHLHILHETFELMQLSDWQQRRVKGQTLPPRACAITFDDGWRDNYEYALPALRETETPATIFAVADMIGTTRRFWPNRIATLLIHHKAALSQLPQAAWLTQLMTQPTPRDHREALAATIAHCKTLSDEDIEAHLDELELALGTDAGKERALMNWDELGAMAASDWVEIGSHTCNHRRLLNSLPAETAYREIVDSRAILQSKLQQPINLFCYPNGNSSALALKLVREHYDLAVTTQRGINQRDTNLHQLLRVGVHESASNSRNQFLARLSGWR
jgi:peptidoglycan/xylan/chitin deacetylase (PgdA/CDA1 family)